MFLGEKDRCDVRNGSLVHSVAGRAAKQIEPHRKVLVERPNSYLNVSFADIHPGRNRRHRAFPRAALPKPRVAASMPARRRALTEPTGAPSVWPILHQ
jgi:hypothetical protein